MQLTEIQDPVHREASIKTASHLRTIAQTVAMRQLSQLSLPEVDQVVNLVAQIVPAGNVPGMILSGLARLPERKPPPNVLQRDVNVLFRAVGEVANKAVYGAVFAAPAAVIWGYQNLLKLAGKEPEDAFPEGTWQFYVDYALRDDTARHTNETYGFDSVLGQYMLRLSPVDRVTAWVMTAIHGLFQYPALLENEWRERVYTSLLKDVTAQLPDAKKYAGVYRSWEGQRPYGRSHDAASLTYPEYRRMKFDRFLEDAMQSLAPDLRQRWLEQVHQAELHDLPAYQQQMTIRAFLEPGPYGETRRPYTVRQARVGVIHEGWYYLLPVCAPGSDQPVDVHAVRAQVAAIFAACPSTLAQSLIPLAQLKRAALAELQSSWNGVLAAERAALQYASILINSDLVGQKPVEGYPRGRLPLSELRQAERGLGDHALTILDSGRSFMFDQSHIFFDGAWGAALAEILTNEALSWALYLNQLPVAVPGAPVRALDLRLSPQQMAAVQQAPQVSAEVGAESDAVNVKAILSLRKLFKRRSDLINLTVNDLLILYRAMHAALYQPSPALASTLRQLSESPATRQAAQAAWESIDPQRAMNPAILIPVDASQRSPRDRLYPMNFDVPLAELDFLGLHVRTTQALDAYHGQSGDRGAVYAEFDHLQRLYLATLAGFGEVLSKAKEIALSGESASIGSIKLLAHIPTPLQRMLEAVPGKFELLNDLIKGREVFSNVGAVASSSTLVRFITAKDDNEKKTLAWGAITDAQGVMRLSLRDFRPHVRLLADAGQRPLAIQMAREYLDEYAQGLNSFVRDLQRITLSSRETKSEAGEEA